MKKVVMFDFDGVIADTFNFCYVLHQKYYPGQSAEEYKKKFEGNINKALKPTTQYKSPDDINRDFFAHYHPELMKQGVIDNMGDAIVTLSEKYDLFIVSSCTTQIIKEFLVKENLLSYFKEILGNDVDHSKVVKIKMLQDKYQVKPETALYITDTLGDIREAQECGIASIGVLWGYHSQETLERGLPIAITQTPAELVTSIQNIFN